MKSISNKIESKLYTYHHFNKEWYGHLVSVRRIIVEVNSVIVENSLKINIDMY